jgi:hypothetical protein
MMNNDPLKLSDLSIAELKLRAAMCLQIANEVKADGDDRWCEARRQLDEINTVLEEKVRSDGADYMAPKPDAIVIEMQPVILRNQRPM